MGRCRIKYLLYYKMNNQKTMLRLSNGTVQTIPRKNLNKLLHNYTSTQKLKTNLESAQKKYEKKTTNVRNLELRLKTAKGLQNQARRELLNVQARRHTEKKNTINALKKYYTVNGVVAKKGISNYTRNIKNYGKKIMPQISFRKPFGFKSR